MNANPAYHQVKPKPSMLMIFIGLTATLAACSSEKTGLDKLRELCEKDAGLTIHETVEADGYYNAYSNDGITNALIKGPYSFYEFCDSSPSKSRYELFPEPGCFRVKKVRRELGECDQRVDKSLSRFVVEPYPEFLKEHCIAVEKIEKPTARYGYYSDFKKWHPENSVSRFTRSDVYIKNNLTEEILGRYVSYSYNDKPGSSIPRGCEIFEGDYISYKNAKLVNTVIQPVKE